MLKIDLHTHTIASGHAFNTINEMAEKASEKGVEILGITDHGPALPGSAPMSYFLCGYRLPKKIKGVRVLFGVEANVVDRNGKLDIPDKYLERLDIVMVGYHKNCGLEATSVGENTQAIINVMKNPLVKVISHPYNKKERFNVDIEKLVKASCEHDVLLEVNCSYFYRNKPKLIEMHDDIKKMISLLKESKRKVIVNSDAHTIWEIGRDEELREKFDYLGLNDDIIINNNKEELLRFLNS